MGGSLAGGIMPALANDPIAPAENKTESDNPTLDGEEVTDRVSKNRIRAFRLDRNNPPRFRVDTTRYYKGETVRWRHVRNGRTINNGTTALLSSSGAGLARINFKSDYLFAAGDRIEVDLIGKKGKLLDSRKLGIDQNINASDPQITGADDVTLEQGASFDPMSGITATGTAGSDLTSQITVTGTVNTSVPGVYNLVYSVTDPVTNLTTSVSRNVTVLPG